MVDKKVLITVREPTPWVSSMVTVLEKNGRVRVCLDPSDLNKAVKWDRYPLTSLEDVVSRLHRARIFSVFNAQTGFLQIKLDKNSSFLMMFNMLFWRYRWLRMPFRLSSAPEIF